MRAHLEPIARTEANSLYPRHITGARFDHPLHYHPEVEIVSIIRSSGTCVIGDHVGAFEEGDLFLIGGNLQHLFTNTLEPLGGAEAEVLQFRRDFSNGFLDATAELAVFVRLLDQSGSGIVFDRNTARRGARILRRIRHARSLDRLRAFMELIDCLVSAERHEQLASPGYAGMGTPQDSERMRIVCRHILEHFSEEISHRDLAAKAHLAPASFCSLFKKVTRKTCTAFINEIRLGHACRLLMESEATITEIAFACGFRNLSNFNRRFRERYHMSPRNYRKRLRAMRDA